MDSTTTTRRPVVYDDESDVYRFDCPWCGGSVEVKRGDVRCRIFRHAYFRNTGRQIGPHTSREHCDTLIATNQVWGCAKPFRFADTYVDQCDYL